MATLVDLLGTTYAPVQAMILPYLGVAEIVALTRTCKGFGLLLPVLGATAWNIDHQLKKFFGDPKKFRSVLGKSEGLITGAFARRFLSRSDIECDNLHIHVEDERKFWKHLVRYLKKDGYKSMGRSPEVFKKTGTKGENLLVSFTYCDHSAIASMFRHAKTTADLNFISWNKACSLLPHSTFVERESFLLVCLSDTIGDHLKVLSDEGVKTKTVSWNQRRVPSNVFHNNYEDPDTMTRRRRIGDKSSWVLNLDVEGVQPPGTPDTVIQATTFRLYAPWKYAQDWQVASYILDFDETIRHPVLKYQYVTLAEDTLDDDGLMHLNELQERERTSHYSRRCEELKDRLDELTLLELFKIPAAERPPEFMYLSGETGRMEEANETRGKFELPTTWTYYDDEVITFLNKAWAEQQFIDERDEPRHRARFFDPTGEQALRDF